MRYTSASDELTYSVIFIRGLPGTGKSTAANYLKEKYNYKIVDPDLISFTSLFRYLFLPSNFTYYVQTLSLKKVRYRYTLKLAINYLKKGHKIIWCQIFSSHEGLCYTIRKIRKESGYTFTPLIITLLCDDPTILERSKSKKWLTQKKLDSIKKRNSTGTDSTTLDIYPNKFINTNCSLQDFYKKMDLLLNPL